MISTDTDELISKVENEKSTGDACPAFGPGAVTYLERLAAIRRWHEQQHEHDWANGSAKEIERVRDLAIVVGQAKVEVVNPIRIGPSKQYMRKKDAEHYVRNGRAEFLGSVFNMKFGEMRQLRLIMTHPENIRAKNSHDAGYVEAMATLMRPEQLAHLGVVRPAKLYHVATPGKRHFVGRSGACKTYTTEKKRELPRSADR